MFRFPALFLVWLCLCAAALAQSALSLSGTVLNEDDGRPVPNATVTALPVGQVVRTDAEGGFRFYSLKAAAIDLTVSAPGYVTQQVPRVRLVSDHPNNMTVTLKQRLYVEQDQVVIARSNDRGGMKTVLTRDDPELKYARTLTEALRSLRGVIVTSTGGGNQTALVSSGGAPANQTAIYLDGLPLNSKLTGDFDLNSIPVASVDRIELYTSAAGGELGVGALAGAVNIITRRAALEGEAALRLGTGSRQSRVTDVSAQGRVKGRLAALVMTSSDRSLNDFEYEDPKLGTTRRENNDRSIGSTLVNLSYLSEEGRRITAGFSEVRSRAGLPGELYALTPSAHKSETFRRWMLQYEGRIIRRLYLTSTIQHYLAHQQFTDHDSYLPYDSKYRDRRLDVSLAPELRATQNQTISARIELSADRFAQENVPAPTSEALGVAEELAQIGVAYSGRLSLAKLPLLVDEVSWQAAVTQTSSNLYGPLRSPSTRLSLEKGRKIRLTVDLSYAGAYRAPTYASLFWSEDAFAVGNPNLRPEKSEEYAVGARLNHPGWGSWQWNAVYSAAFIRDLIFWERRFDGKYVPQNLAAAKVKLVKAQMVWTWPHDLGKLSTDWVLTDARDRSWAPNYHDQQLTFRPRNLIDAAWQVTPRPFLLQWSTRWVSQRYIRRADTKVLPAYTITDVKCAATLHFNGWQVAVSADLDNLFNERYELIERYPMPGRSFALGLEIKYGHSSGGRDGSQQVE